MLPTVSVCVPNLNTRPYLAERFETIFVQTLQDWELIVYDSYSDDGAWEYIQQLAAREPRMQISQGPREGTPASWNPCIRQARGKYVYIATSDDTMTPDCLEQLVGALERHPECGLAHCCATFIDEHGRAVSEPRTWEDWPAAKYFGDLLHVEHIRPPGHDAVLACALRTPYYSMTQVLIRRELLSQVGLFETQWGSFGDLAWQMRCSLLTATVHVPAYLATWRIHPSQATQNDRHLAAMRDGLYVRMVDSLIAFSRQVRFPGPEGLPCRLRRFFAAEQIQVLYRQLPWWQRLAWLVRRMVADSSSVRCFLRLRCRRRCGCSNVLEREVRAELSRLRIGQPLVPD
jgi:glycosyltransferase involved in cell wall biosynthesis